jgi:isoleucyl-tRNA synthetase
VINTPQIEWSQLLELRTLVSRELEQLRNSGAIGAPLDAGVTIYADDPVLSLLNGLGDELRFVFITSEAKVVAAKQRPTDAVSAQTSHSSIWINVDALDHAKCVRCWQKRADVGQTVDHPELCGRCVSNVSGSGEVRHYV